MTSYGGYSRTSYNAQGGEDAGGFMGGSQPGGTQGGQKNSYQDESLRPVTIKQLLDLEEAYPGATITLDGQAITQVTFVGQVRSLTAMETNITYRVDDGTGTIDVKKWIDPDKREEALAAAEYPLDSFVRVWGRIRSYNDKRHVSALFVRAVDDFNEVNYHLLEAAYVHLYFTKGPPGGGGASGGGGGGGDDGMFVDSYGGGGGGGGYGMSKASNCSSNAQKLYNFMQNNASSNEGIEANVIARGANMSVRDVEAAADELLSSGLIYTTLDDHTWAILDY